MTMPNYTPGQLYPGSTGLQPQYINRPATAYTSGPGVNAIEQRWRQIQAAGNSYDPTVQDFLGRDAPRLIAIAHAAFNWAQATNAEQARQAAENLHAIFRQPMG